MNSNLPTPPPRPAPPTNRWRGFAPPRANVLYCPNQFFDVTLPHGSRGVVRLVAYLIWRTFAWNAPRGGPRRREHALTWAELVAKAGVSRGALGRSLREARVRGFVRVEGKADGTVRYALHFAPQGPYVRSPEAFRGFFSGAGHRTYVPNEFFTVVAARESLAVTRVVGAVIRQSIGFEAERGFRRTAAALSVRVLARITHLTPRHAHAAVRVAVARGYLRCLAPGEFGGRARPAAARYALCWADDASGAAPRGTPVSSKRDTGSVQEGTRSRFKKGYSDKKEIKTLNDIFAPQASSPPSRARTSPSVSAAAAAGSATSGLGTTEIVRERLRGLGFRGEALTALARFPLARIERQAQWLAARSPQRNALGLLRRAIEEDWPAPAPRPDPRASTAVVVAASPTTADTPTPSCAIDVAASADQQHYLRTMTGALERLATAEPARFAAFEAFRNTLKRQLQFLHRDRPEHGILKFWDRDATRIAHWRSFDPTVPDFERWRRERDPEP